MVPVNKTPETKPDAEIGFGDIVETGEKKIRT